MIKIERFIENFKKGMDKDKIEEFFLHGNCFHFALIIESIYGGDIVYDPHNQHFSLKRRNVFYDISGKIEEPFDFLYWADLEEEESEEYEELKRDCVFKAS